jgi:hypothetical protein
LALAAIKERKKEPLFNTHLIDASFSVSFSLFLLHSADTNSSCSCKILLS